MADDNLKTTWSSLLTQIYLTDRRPVNGSYDHRAVEEKARELPTYTPLAVPGPATRIGTTSRHFSNGASSLVCFMTPLTCNLETTLFGVKLPSPVLIAPVGVQGILHEGGELATASAAASVGVPFIMSNASSRSIEAVAMANGDGHRWYQLYWPRSNDVMFSVLGRAKAAGFTVLVVTVDAFLLGWRAHSLDTAYRPFTAGVGVQVGTSDPVFMQRMGLPVRPDERPAFPLNLDAFRQRLAAKDEQAALALKLSAGWQKEASPGLFRTWEDLKLLRDSWDGPIVLKGIQSVDDAHAAMDAQMDGIVVSNHGTGSHLGGRQVDGAISSFSALEKITASSRVLCAQKEGTFTVLFDSGIRQGSDIIKAIAMGAQGVLIGRPFMYGLAIAGEKGVEEVLRSLLAETEITLGLSGYKNIEEIWAKRGAVIEKANTSPGKTRL
ncbi:FMN-dependent alpha-hydroxy acid dehydrogenase [Lactarius vividus]|nr:FMN-dependent alpha-hydroxy acid dehydrogenase [Lactarius vividus]